MLVLLLFWTCVCVYSLSAFLPPPPPPPWILVFERGRIGIWIEKGVCVCIVIIFTTTKKMFWTREHRCWLLLLLHTRFDFFFVSKNVQSVIQFFCLCLSVCLNIITQKPKKIIQTFDDNIVLVNWKKQNILSLHTQRHTEHYVICTNWIVSKS